MRRLLRLSLAILLGICSTTAFAKIFCVTTSAEFDDALDEASTNNADDLIKLAAGTYRPTVPTGFFANLTDQRALTVSGGFTSGSSESPCEISSRNAYLTIIDGASSTGLLYIAPYSLAAPVSLFNLTFQGAHGGSEPVVLINGQNGWSGDAALENVVIRNNQSNERILLVNTFGLAFVRNSEIVDNTSISALGATVASITAGVAGGEDGVDRIYFNSNTVANNSSPDGRALLLGTRGGSIRMANNIVWNEGVTDLDGDDRLYMSHNDIHTYSGPAPAENIAPFDADPGFMVGSYQLSAVSPLRDAGINSVPGGVGLVDIDDRPRIVGTAVDLGAHELGDTIFEDGFECLEGCP